MMHRRILGALVLSAFSLAAMTSSSRAAHVWGNYSGTTVDYVSVTETTNSAGDPEPIFSPLGPGPSISGNDLNFSPTDFESSAAGAGDADITTATMTYDLEATSGTIDTVSFAEYFSYIMTGTGTAATSVSITGAMTVTVVESGGVPGFYGFETASLTTTSPYELGVDPSSASGLFTFMEVDLSGYNATKVKVSLNNNLQSNSEDGTTAFIEKSDISLRVNNPVPEPSTIVLLVTGALGLGIAVIRRRRR